MSSILTAVQIGDTTNYTNKSLLFGGKLNKHQDIQMFDLKSNKYE